jgi:hypothetical protein
MKVATFLLLLFASCYAYQAEIYIGTAPPTSTFNIRNVKFGCPLHPPPPPALILAGRDVSLNAVLECLQTYTPNECELTTAPRLTVNLVKGADLPAPPEETENAIVSFFVEDICNARIYLPPFPFVGSSPLAIDFEIYSPHPVIEVTISVSAGDLFLIYNDTTLNGPSITFQGSAAFIRQQLLGLLLTGDVADAVLHVEVRDPLTHQLWDSAFAVVSLVLPTIDIPAPGATILNTGNSTLEGTYPNATIIGGTLNVPAGGNVVLDDTTIQGATLNIAGNLNCDGCTFTADTTIVLQPGANLTLGDNAEVKSIVIVDGAVIVIVGPVDTTGSNITLINGGSLIIGGPPVRRRSARAGTLIIGSNIDQAANAGPVIVLDFWDLVQFTGTNIFRAQFRTDTVVEFIGTTFFDFPATILLGPNNNVAKAHVFVTGLVILRNPPGPSIGVRVTVNVNGRLQGIGSMVLGIPLVVKGQLAVGPNGDFTAQGPVTFEGTSRLVIMFAPTTFGRFTNPSPSAVTLLPGFQVVFENAPAFTGPPPIQVAQINNLVGLWPTTGQQLGSLQVIPAPNGGILQYISNPANTGGIPPPPTPSGAPSQPTSPSVLDILSPTRPVQKKSSSKIGWIIPIALGGTLVVFLIIGAIVFFIMKKKRAAATETVIPPKEAGLGYTPAYPPAPPASPYGGGAYPPVYVQ